MVNDSCKEARNGTDISFKFEYSFEEVDGNMGDENGRRAQSIGQGPPVGRMPPIDGFNQTIYGWRIEGSNDLLEGSCFTAPNIIAGPFPHVNLTSCVHDLEFACFRITNELIRRENQQCPCFDEDVMASIKRRMMSRIYDPDFQIDMNLSCKSPQQNNGLPYGLYTKPNGIKNKMYGSTFRLGVDISLDDSTELNNVTNKCYYKDDHQEPMLTVPQHTQCVSLMQNLCLFVNQIFKPAEPPAQPPKKQPNPSSCSDNVDFRYKGKSCENMFGNASRRKTRRKTRRACKKYDYDTKKFVFQHCRESCRMCTCRDKSDFYLNDVPEYSCSWLSKLEPQEKRSLCYRKEVAENCVVTCESKCCKNSPNFSYYKKVEYGQEYKNKKARNHYKWDKRTCADVNNANWIEECKTKSVAINCPMICRKCFIQPR